MPNISTLLCILNEWQASTLLAPKTLTFSRSRSRRGYCNSSPCSSTRRAKNEVNTSVQYLQDAQGPRDIGLNCASKSQLNLTTFLPSCDPLECTFYFSITKYIAMSSLTPKYVSSIEIDLLGFEWCYMSW